MSVSYKITDVVPIATDLVKVVYQFTPFDNAITEIMYLPTSLTDTQIKAIISAKISTISGDQATPTSEADSNLTALKSLIGNTYVATTPH